MMTMMIKKKKKRGALREYPRFYLHRAQAQCDPPPFRDSSGGDDHGRRRPSARLPQAFRSFDLD
jgi:hypothetical protein